MRSTNNWNSVYVSLSRDGCSGSNKYVTFLNCNKFIHNERLSRHRVIIILQHTSVDTMSRSTHFVNYLVFIISIFERLLTHLICNIILLAIFFEKSNTANARIYLIEVSLIGARGQSGLIIL